MVLIFKKKILIFLAYCLHFVFYTLLCQVSLLCHNLQFALSSANRVIFSLTFAFYSLKDNSL